MTDDDGGSYDNYTEAVQSVLIIRGNVILLRDGQKASGRVTRGKDTVYVCMCVTGGNEK